MTQIYVDMDGVLADFDRAAWERLGLRDPRKAESDLGGPEFWRRIGAIPHYYRSLPLMPDARVLWAGVLAARPRPPIILTGVPWSIATAVADKRAWAAEHFPCAAVITCAAKDKARYCRPGDILIDDWPKYRALWEAAGGTFIVHTSAATSLEVLAQATCPGCSLCCSGCAADTYGLEPEPHTCR